MASPAKLMVRMDVRMDDQPGYLPTDFLLKTSNNLVGAPPLRPCGVIRF